MICFWSHSLIETLDGATVLICDVRHGLDTVVKPDQLGGFHGTDRTTKTQTKILMKSNQSNNQSVYKRSTFVARIKRGLCELSVYWRSSKRERELYRLHVTNLARTYSVITLIIFTI